MNGTQILFRLLNPLTKIVLKSRLHRIMSSKFIVLIFRGRTSRKEYSLPLSYLEGNDKKLFCITDKEYIWWRNLTDGNTIQILLKGKLHNANIRVESENTILIGEKLKAMCLQRLVRINTLFPCSEKYRHPWVLPVSPPGCFHT